MEILENPGLPHSRLMKICLDLLTGGFFNHAIPSNAAAALIVALRYQVFAKSWLMLGSLLFF